ncbi:ATP-binding protein [Cognataquiflexum rubidum]|uniref:ATP-binding protein n=1 Tax=Cognataquiflexum rubidum TaxID=2922273 RepID=UPI001F148FA2|nr:ATP-binding protein [Cognataquiflexum rubidum]MCH6235783.1 ATP-binding protein [Cognataquiflexum rubidum]
MTIFLIPLICNAQRYSDQVVEIKGIPEFGILLDQGWKFKAGDNPDWALPDFPDDTWEMLDPTPDVRDVSPLWDAGRGWLRIKLKLDSALALQSIVMQVQQSTATEFYLDGQLIHRAGHIGEDPADVKARRIFADELLNLPLRPGQVHTLAVRIGVQKNMPYATWAADFTTALTVRVFDAYQGSLFVKNSDNSKLEMFNNGLFFILFLLHFALFLSNRSKKANLYFSIFLFLYFFSGAINSNWTDSVEVQYIRFYFILLFFYSGYVFYYLAIQKILEIKRTKYVFIFFGAIGLIVIGSQYFYQYGSLLVSIPFLLLTLEFLRICLIGVKNRKRGAALILGGSTASFVFYLLFILAAARIIPQGDYFFWGHIYYFLAFVVLPVTISIYLALEYSFLSKALSRKLREVKFLSEKNQRQAEEKRKLLESQNETLEQKVAERTAALNQSLEDLKSTQAQLIQSEKMASLGELTAGIAHEIQNPLNFVNNFSEVSSELLDEMNQELDKGDIDEAKFIANDIKQNLEKINHHGKRADAIVKGMLEHSRTSSGEKVPTDINALADEYLRLSYHGMRAKDKSFNADFVTDFDPNLPKINVVPQEIGRVLLNIINNAFQAFTNSEFFPDSYRDHNSELKPLVKVSTMKNGDNLEIRVSDNGPGIPDAIKDKIFQPFFTTKPTGQGTGLGLSLSYDIVKAHGGEIKVESEEGKGTSFIILLPTQS